MTEQEIRFNYDKAMSQAEELKEIAKDLKKVGEDSMEDCLVKVEKNWVGDNATDYVKKAKTVQTKITTSAGNVSSAAAALETMAKNIYNAEMAALEAARARTY